MKKVVLLGGGVGSATFTRALKDLPVELTTIVSTFDDGGSTGAIRRDYGGWAVGDFRLCLLSGLDLDRETEDALNYRFGPGHLYGINTGNLLLKAYLAQFKNQRIAIRNLHKMLGLKNKVLPVSFAYAELTAQLTNGNALKNEDQIATYYSFSKAHIKTLRLSKTAPLNPDVRTAIRQADYLVMVPGHFFTSVLPHLYVKGFAEAWKKSRAKKIWVVNLLAHNGWDNFMDLRAHLGWFERKLGRRPFDLAVANSRIPQSVLRAVSDRFSETKITPEDLQYLKRNKIELIKTDLAANAIRKQQPNDTVMRAPLRHDAKKIQKFFRQIFA